MTASALDRLEWLKRQIALGWQVEAPVIERATERPSDYSLAYEFILRHDRGYQVIAVPDCPELQRFIREHALGVVNF